MSKNVALPILLSPRNINDFKSQGQFCYLSFDELCIHLLIRVNFFIKDLINYYVIEY